jgi:hypothetical protein
MAININRSRVSLANGIFARLYGLFARVPSPRAINVTSRLEGAV